jgi:hypothetical protein
MTIATKPSGRYCRKCDYDLSASDGPVCPECGRAFSPANPQTFRAHARRSLRGRWRRWRWLIVPALLLAAAWPRGWTLTRITWIDPAGSAIVEANALVIGHPWWLGGWYHPIVWGSTTGAVKPQPKPASARANLVEFTDELWLCDSVWPWHSQMLGRGRLAVLGPSTRLPLADADWRAKIEKYVRTVASGTAKESAEALGMSIVAPVASWKCDGPDDFVIP